MDANVIKLPLRRSVREAWLLSVYNFGYWLRVSWAWAVLTLPPMILAYGELSPEGAPLDTSDFRVFALDTLIYALMPLPMLASTAVAWHKLLVDDERVKKAVYLGAGPAVWRYGFVVLVFQLFVVVPLIIIAGLVSSPFAGGALLGVVLVIAALALVTIVVGLLASCRLSLLLVGTALERPGTTTGWAWDAGRGSTARILIGSLITGLLSLVTVGICLAIALQVAELPSQRWTSVTRNALNALLANSIIYLPTLAFLSVAYMRLVPGSARSDGRPDRT